MRIDQRFDRPVECLWFCWKRQLMHPLSEEETTVRISSLLLKWKENGKLQERCEAMDELLKNLRNQRPYSIQTDLQYLYVHRIMLCYFIDKYGKGANNPEIVSKYKKFADDYDKATA
ncbi:hypothetical protein L596_013259 [Steinernema carpocapsae]|uniref:Tyrosine-protein phosphatase domain-containing protein n=1 Tax=Steinernema carpocapsae TaxID=34508 RepID=A0A4U5P051_STECR|nr:hypothetical protein L596_013259 [Steinernema carpocapsae]